MFIHMIDSVQISTLFTFISTYLLTISECSSALLPPLSKRFANTGTGGEQLNYGFLNGEKSKITKHPYQAALLQGESDLVGTAVIIDRSWLVTSARNVYKHTPAYKGSASEADEYIVRVGSDVPDEGGSVYNIDAVIIHPNATGFWNDDIALLHTAQQIQISGRIFFRKVNVIKIAQRLPKQNEDITVSGWGGQEKLSVEYLTVPMIRYEDCKPHYIKDVHLTPTSFCTAVIEAGPCSVDSGGPVVVQTGKIQKEDRLVGVFSGTDVCGSIVHPAVYTDITQYTDWITDVIYNFNGAL